MRKIYTNTIAPGVYWGLKARNYGVIHYREGGLKGFIILPIPHQMELNILLHL